MKATYLRGQIVALAEAVLAGELSCIAASRSLHALGNCLFDDLDDDFIPFMALNSETDHLPLGSGERAGRSEETLRQLDLEFREIEGRERAYIEQACQNLIHRFRWID